MVINKKLSDSFLEIYQKFLIFSFYESDSDQNIEDLLKILIQGRSYYLKNRELLDDYIAKNGKIDSDTMIAIKSLEVDNWIYLRDTSKYSIFINNDISVSYAVYGLTQPIKEILGASGFYMEAGLVSLGDKFVCDGLLSSVVQLGSNYKSDFNDSFRDLKKNKWFYESPPENN